jgi:hypothetical protein
MPFPSPPHTLKIGKWQHPISIRTLRPDFNESCAQNGPNIFQTQHLISYYWSQSNVKSPWQWKVKHYLILVHLYVSLTRNWCENIDWRRQTKVLLITIGSHFNKIIFNVISSLTNLIIIGLFWFTFYNPRVDWHTKSFHFEPLNDETLECKALSINIFGVDHDYHMDVFKRWYMGWLMGANFLRYIKILS